MRKFEKCDHNNLAQAGDPVYICTLCGSALLDIEKQRQEINDLRNRLDKFPNWIKRIFL